MPFLIGKPYVKRWVRVLFFLLFLGEGCAGATQKPAQVPETVQMSPVRTGYTIQVGAFRVLDNAVNLTHSLTKRGLDAYYFRTQKGLFKVRFGDFSSWAVARRNAGQLVRAGVFDEYYVVPPSHHPVSRLKETTPPDEVHGIREEIVETARTFIGLPYRWGGSSREKGYDCSGLVVAVYHLNGISLPRTSREQYRVGKPLSRGEISPGDLVFFDINGRKRISHVGIYLGNGKFLHAPGRGKTIRTDLLSNSYYAPRFKGARSCL
jgi:cell wall-associated NlpC family hydrolase